MLNWNLAIGPLIFVIFWNLGTTIRDGNRILMIRMLGNDLEGLHGTNQTYNNLKFTLEWEPTFPGVDKVFVLNRIVDNVQRDRIRTLLDRQSVQYLEIPYDPTEFKKLGELSLTQEELEQLNKLSSLEYKRKIIQTLYPFNQYLVNNNGCRNFCIQYGKEQGYEWTFVLDGNSFLTEKYFKQMLTNVPKGTEYIIVPQIRLDDGGFKNEDIVSKPLELDRLPIQEPQIAFHIQSQHRFKEDICYGVGPKAELLTALGIPGNWTTWSRSNSQYLQMCLQRYQRKRIHARCLTAGKIIRLHSYVRDNNVRANWSRRFVGIYLLYQFALHPNGIEG